MANNTQDYGYPAYDSHKRSGVQDGNPVQEGGGFKDKLKKAGHDVAQKWKNLPKAAKIGIPAGGTAAAVAITGVGLANSPHEEELSPEQFQSGQLAYDKGETALRDGAGRPALLNYFNPAQDRVLEVSIATQLPEVFQNGNQAGDYLDTVNNHARSHTTRTEVYFETVCTGSGDTRSCSSQPRTRIVTDYHYYNYDLEIEKDFKPATKEQEDKVRAFFDEFTQATGIPVRITHDNPDAHITVANYLNRPNWVMGTLDYVEPGEIVSAPPGSIDSRNPAMRQGFVIMNDRNWGEGNSIEDDIAKTIGFESGKANWVTLREQLTREGVNVPQLNTGDSTIDLNGTAQAAPFLPERVVVDNGGQNTLVGTDKNDTLIAEAGYCGATDTPTNKLTNIFGNGRGYCVAEGEIAVVKGGEGDDLIITSRAGKQQIDGGAGDNRIVFFQPEIGDKTILASEGGNNTLFIHDDLVHSGHVQVTQNGDDITLHFTAPSGREVGTITLEDQLNGGGISQLTVVDDKGVVAYTQDVKGLSSLTSWQEDVVKPMEDALFKQAHEALPARMGRRNQGLSGVPARGPSGGRSV